MTRPELAEAIRALPDDEKLDLLGELWDAIDESATVVSQMFFQKT